MVRYSSGCNETKSAKVRKPMAIGTRLQGSEGAWGAPWARAAAGSKRSGGAPLGPGRPKQDLTTHGRHIWGPLAAV